ANEAIYTYTAAATGILEVTLDSMADMGLYARSTCNDPATEIACADAFSGGNKEMLDVFASSGETVAIFVDGYAALENGPFTITSTFVETNEVEPNGTFQTANTLASPVAAIYPPGDHDWFTVTTVGPATISVEVQDLGDGACAVGKLDSYVELFATDG